jgi:hypothetical protein
MPNCSGPQESYRASDSSSSAFEIGTLQRLFLTRAIAIKADMYDVSADGQRFLVNLG